MKWRDARASTNVRNAGGGGMGMLPVGGGAAVIIAIIVMLMGGDPGAVLNQGAAPAAEGTPNTDTDSTTEFVKHVLGDTEDTWKGIFTQMGRTYEEPILNTFSGSVQSACGMASAAVGPFYCAANREVYIDLTFFQELTEKFGAPGDVAQAYVIAHEVGHHVQNLLGLSDQVASARQGASNTTANRLSVRMELQADCFAGIWAYSADKQRHLIQTGDINEALNAAAAIGDDRLQQEAQGHVSPESFTHGTSAQRADWFNRGYNSGDIRQCDTFKAGAL